MEQSGSDGIAVVTEEDLLNSVNELSDELNLEFLHINKDKPNNVTAKIIEEEEEEEATIIEE